MTATSWRRALAAAAIALTACARPTAPSSSRAPNSSTSSVGIPTSSTSTSRDPLATTITTTATGQGSRGLADTDLLQRQHRLAQALPHQTSHYGIDFTVGTDGRLQLRVTLLAVLNNRRDLAAYEAQLRQYKAEALAFIQVQGDDPTSYTVAFLPPEAAAL